MPQESAWLAERKRHGRGRRKRTAADDERRSQIPRRWRVHKTGFAAARQQGAEAIPGGGKMTCTIYTELSSARKGSSLFSDLTHAPEGELLEGFARVYRLGAVLEVKKEVLE